MRTPRDDRLSVVVDRDGRPTLPDRRCPHGIDHPRWCPTCRPHWQSRMHHPSWPRHRLDDGA